jgi:hypothetical protein
MGKSSTSRRTSLAPAAPWFGLAVLLAGAALLFFGWWKVSGEARAAAQMPYLASSSIPGAALLVMGFLLLLRRSGPARDRRVDTLIALLTEPSSGETVSAGPERTTGALVAVDGATLFHHADCVLVAGKDRHAVDDALVSTKKLLACPLCIHQQ